MSHLHEPPLLEPLHSEACERNKAPIAEQLVRLAESGARVWEVGCGTGQHAVHMAATLPGVRWFPTDRAGGLQSVALRRAAHPALPIEPPRAFDLADDAPAVRDVDGVFCANVLHIAPLELGLRLFAHAAAALRPGGWLAVYGPFRFAEAPLAPSNAEFDAWLRARDPSSGIRDLDDLTAQARACGFGDVEATAMPANNHLLVWRLPTG